MEWDVDMTRCKENIGGKNISGVSFFLFFDSLNCLLLWYCFLISLLHWSEPSELGLSNGSITEDEVRGDLGKMELKERQGCYLLHSVCFLLDHCCFLPSSIDLTGNTIEERNRSRWIGLYS